MADEHAPLTDDIRRWYGKIGRLGGMKGGRVRAARMGPDRLRDWADKMNEAKRQKAAAKKARAEHSTDGETRPDPPA